MKSSDLPPGQRRLVLSRAGEVEPGDLLNERTARLDRVWEVVFIERARVYWHAAVRPVELDEIAELLAAGATWWSLVR